MFAAKNKNLQTNLHILLYERDKLQSMDVIMMDERYLLDETDLRSKIPRNAQTLLQGSPVTSICSKQQNTSIKNKSPHLPLRP